MSRFRHGPAAGHRIYASDLKRSDVSRKIGQGLRTGRVEFFLKFPAGGPACRAVAERRREVRPHLGSRMVWSHRNARLVLLSWP